MKKKYDVGDLVKVKTGNISNKFYSNRDGSGDFFFSKMEEFKGMVATVMKVNSSGYSLDIDDGLWNYTDNMLVSVVDIKSSNNYVAPEDYIIVGLAIIKSQMDMYMKLINESLDNKDKEEFYRLSKLYCELEKDYRIIKSNEEFGY